MKMLTIILLLLTFISCGKDVGGKSAEKKSESETLTIGREENDLKEKILKKKSWKQSDLMKTIVLARGTNKYTFRKLDQLMNINCNQATGNCSPASKEIQ